MLPSVLASRHSLLGRFPVLFSGLQARANPQAVPLFDKHTRSQGPFLRRRYPTSTVVLPCPPPASTVALRRRRGRYPRAKRASPNYPAHPSDMPCPLPRWTETGASDGCFPVPLGPSPLFRRVGVHDFTFEACSGFTHVTACRIAQPPKGGLCHEASARSVARSSCSSATRVYRQLPAWNLPPLVNRAVGAH
jgi:hypothetical protein